MDEIHIEKKFMSRLDYEVCNPIGLLNVNFDAENEYDMI